MSRNIEERIVDIRRSIWKIFVLNISGEYIIYNPLDRLVCKCNKDMAELISLMKKSDISDDEILRSISDNERHVAINYLINIVKPSGISYEEFLEMEKKLEGINDNSLSLHSMALIPTYKCNLRCIYCYSRGGEKNISMSWKIAKASIDFFLTHRNREVEPMITFHGGGEPTLCFELVKNATEYIKEKLRSEKITMAIVTNGVFPLYKAEWIAENMDYVLVSFDGPKDIHDFHRPFPNGKGSYKYVVRTIKYLVNRGINVVIGATITEHSIYRMKEIIDQCALLGVNEIEMQPLAICGRCYDTMLKPLNGEEYAKYLSNVINYAEELGIKIGYALSRLGKIRLRHCHASGLGICVTPEGIITTCVESTDCTDPNSDAFILGKYNGSDFVLDYDKFEMLRRRIVDNIPKCKGCFCKWHCGGGCPAQAYRENGDIFKPSRFWCEFMKSLMNYHILNLLKKKSIHS